MGLKELIDKIMVIGFEVIPLVLIWIFAPWILSIILTVGMVGIILLMRALIKEGYMKTSTPTVFWLGEEYLENIK